VGPATTRRPATARRPATTRDLEAPGRPRTRSGASNSLGGPPRSLRSVPRVGLEPTLLVVRFSSAPLAALGTPGRIRTDTGWCLRPLPLPLGYRGCRRMFRQGLEFGGQSIGPGRLPACGTITGTVRQGRRSPRLPMSPTSPRPVVHGPPIPRRAKHRNKQDHQSGRRRVPSRVGPPSSALALSSPKMRP
jgi:hypothetical protein